jgi:hypothetical protein
VKTTNSSNRGDIDLAPSPTLGRGKNHDGNSS